jgi:hypothetical protein
VCHSSAISAVWLVVPFAGRGTTARPAFPSRLTITGQCRPKLCSSIVCVH